jgi:rod shape-determining protein MreB and related proteins
MIKSILTKISRSAKAAWQMPSFSAHTKVGLDIGTAFTRIAIHEKGIVLREPTFVGHNVRTGQALFLGEEAKQIYGKAPEFIKIIKPFENSIISDFDATVSLVQAFLKKAVYPYYHASFIRKGLAAYAPVPTSSTEVEQKALQEALIKAGFQEAYLVDKPVVTAIGAGYDVFSNKPVFVIDLGAGSVEMAIIIMGGIVSSRVLKIGGDHMDKLIYNYLHLKYGLIVGEQTAELLKNDLYALNDSKEVKAVRGKSLENGLPKSVRVSAADIREALSVPLNRIIDGIKELIESAPPEIIDGMIRSGAVLTGSLAKVPDIDQFIMREVKMPVVVAKDPEDATIRGIASLFNDPEHMKRVIINY